MALDPAAAGRPLTLEFAALSASGVAFSVQVVPLADSGEGIADGAIAAEVLQATAGGHCSYLIPAGYDRLGLIVTRLDAGEALDALGEYAIVLG